MGVGASYGRMGNGWGEPVGDGLCWRREGRTSKGRGGGGVVDEGDADTCRAGPDVRQEGQLLGDGRDGSVRAVQRDTYRPWAGQM